MNKSMLIDAVATKAGLPKASAAKAVDAALAAVTESLQAGEEVALIGFGTFTVKERAARTGRDPRTGKPIEISASKTPAFRPGKALKDAVN